MYRDAACASSAQKAPVPFAQKNKEHRASQTLHSKNLIVSAEASEISVFQTSLADFSQPRVIIYPGWRRQQKKRPKNGDSLRRNARTEDLNENPKDTPCHLSRVSYRFPSVFQISMADFSQPGAIIPSALSSTRRSKDNPLGDRSTGATGSKVMFGQFFHRWLTRPK
jgi:hypothetical protein